MYLEGLGVALITPFDKKNKIDFIALANVINHVKSYASYLVINGTTGEAATTTTEEKNQILNFVKSHAHNLPIVCGIGGNNTSQIIETINNTDLNGVSAIMSISPYYNKPSQQGIYLHYKAIANSAKVPIILYNVPGRTGSNIEPETVAKLAEHSNIIGIKEASGNLIQCIEIIKICPSNFTLISGDDMLTLPIRSIGGKGAISVLANAFPEQMQIITNGTYEESAKTTLRLSYLNRLLYKESNTACIKYILNYMNLCNQEVRLPLCDISEVLKEEVIMALKAFLV
jgi:4-hydroxy-tetrahydrodipicolinate synthase